jgi:arylsulfatase
MVRELDWHVGEIVSELERLSIADNTIIFFLSDNGPWLTNDKILSAGSAWPLKGSKFNTFEGGHRVPAIVKYPGKIAAGKVFDELVSTMDIFPTIASITGVSLPKNKVIDGRNIWPILQNPIGAKSPHKVLYGYQGKNLQTIRKGKWKLHLPRSPQSVPFYASSKWGSGTVDSLIQPLLFNLENDIEERNNVANEYPEILKNMLLEAEKARIELGDWNRTGMDEHPYNGFHGDFHAYPVDSTSQGK